MEYYLSGLHRFCTWNFCMKLASTRCCNHPVLLTHDVYLDCSIAPIIQQLHWSPNLDLLFQPLLYPVKSLVLDICPWECNLNLYISIRRILALNHRDSLSNHQTSIVSKGPRFLDKDHHLLPCCLLYQITHSIFSLLSFQRIFIHFMFSNLVSIFKLTRTIHTIHYSFFQYYEWNQQILGS